MSTNAIDPKTNPDHPNFDNKAAAEYTGLSTNQLDRARWSHKIDYFHIGNVVRYSQSQLDAYLDSCRVTAKAAG